jgi:SAM-dependent methyltransferase
VTFKRAAAAPYFIFRDYKRARREFDWKFGVDTDGSIPLTKLDIESPNKVYGANYGATRPDIFWEAIENLKINYQDFIFLDLGSGKGRVVLLASELPFKEIIGVEFSPELNDIAEVNIRKYESPTQRCKKIKLVRRFSQFCHSGRSSLLFYVFSLQGARNAVTCATH